ncbi:MAG: galactose-1-phosphate uridylyltransferase [Candidatus Kariarchaeaceae archaeon]|jgi:UDPglucose--hexose-1-phosphate uridylyltransferase
MQENSEIPPAIHGYVPSELRYDPLKDHWVLIAAERQSRPFMTHKTCPFCRGSTEVPDEFSTIFLPNKYPSLSLNFNDTENEQIKPGRGICEVIVYTPDHSINLWDLEDSGLIDVISKWKQRYIEITSKHPEIEYIYIFENSGVEIGVSLDHPHGQLYAFPIIPPIIQTEMKAFEDMSECIFCESIVENLICDTDTFRAVIPSYSKWPYEVHVISKRHISTLDSLNNQEISDLAFTLKEVLYAFSVLFEDPVPYILAVHQAPHNYPTHEKFHFHIEISTPMRGKNLKKFMAGVEEGMGIYINTVSPKSAARKLTEIVNKTRNQ